MALEILNLCKEYQGRPVVQDVSFNIQPGEIVGLLGPNGAGKTTSFYAVVGIIQPNKGNILLNGKDVSKSAIHDRARAGIGYLPQETSVFRKLSVIENLLLILEMMPLSGKERLQRAEQLMEEFGVTHLRNKPAIQLSGGERRRVEIARALASNPSFLLLDEPFTGIDPLAIQDIQQLIHKLKQRGIGVLMTDHNPKATLSIVDRAYIMYDGRIIFQGTSEEVSQSELVRETYLGESLALVL
jgi:lipopolysaccharide export system ATP-binding protein